jgi:4-methylaminobutanoate oxidase (formaldehyde-forming)
VDIRRFGRPHDDIEWVRTRTMEMYGKHYTVAWPFEEHESGRPLRRSPLYERLAEQGACFGEKLGWERPNWFAPQGVAPRDEYSFGRQNWFDHVGTEHRAARERAALFDQTSFAKFQMVGKDAEAALTWIMLNRGGGIECDLTVARLAPDRFYITTGTGFATHDFAWIRANIPAGLDAHLTEVTDANSVLSLMGPASRKVLAAVTGDDLSDATFPFGAVRQIAIAGAPITALRVTYVGELGWELHVPVESAARIYDLLMARATVPGARISGRITRRSRRGSAGP